MMNRMVVSAFKYVKVIFNSWLLNWISRKKKTKKTKKSMFNAANVRNVCIFEQFSTLKPLKITSLKRNNHVFFFFVCFFVLLFVLVEQNRVEWSRLKIVWFYWISFMLLRTICATFFYWYYEISNGKIFIMT